MLYLLFVIEYNYFLLFCVIGLPFDCLEESPLVPDDPINYAFKYPPTGGSLINELPVISEYGSRKGSLFRIFMFETLILTFFPVFGALCLN